MKHKKKTKNEQGRKYRGRRKSGKERSWGEEEKRISCLNEKERGNENEGRDLIKWGENENSEGGEKRKKIN